MSLVFLNEGNSGPDYNTMFVAELGDGRLSFKMAKGAQISCVLGNPASLLQLRQLIDRAVTGVTPEPQQPVPDYICPRCHAKMDETL